LGFANLPSATNIVATNVLGRATGTSLLPGSYAPLLDMLVSNGYREYKLKPNPSECDLNQRTGDPSKDPNLFVFPYDWTKSNADNAHKLASYVQCVQEFYHDSKVDMVTNSMGSLVARRYILDNPGKVSKLITVGAPWLGAPKMTVALTSGVFMDDKLFDPLLWPRSK
jgi:pimeloyl-ACP methyl ester carboxylesterase